MRYLTVLLLPLLLLSGTHPAALSHLELRYEQEELVVGLRIQELTLREVPRWALDQDASGHISNFELENQWDRLASMIEETMWLELDGQVVHPRFDIVGYEGAADTAADGSYDFSHVQLEAELPLPSDLSSLKVHSDLFLEDGNPGHKLVITVEGVEEKPLSYVLKADHRDYELHIPTAFEVVGQYTYIGWEHVLEGYDHLAFLIALLFGVATFGRLLGAVTAFTLAHSITLALAAMDIVRLPASLVEPGIAVSVLVVLLLHLRRPVQQAHPWIPAFAFGLLHGFGFAGVLGDIGIPPSAKTEALLGFNLGVEGGQLTFVIPVILAGWLLRRTVNDGTWTKVRDWLALPTLSFAMFLVGNACLSYLFPELEGWTARLVLLGIGCGTGIALCSIPGGLQETFKKVRTQVVQAGLLLFFFSAGQLLQG